MTSLEKYVTLSHGRTRYLEAGSGEPVILLHGVGFAGGGDHWRFVSEQLSHRFRVIAPDFVGWGMGDRFPREYSFAYLVDFVRELQDALGIDSAHVVGHSMGGWMATLFGYESPNRVKRLVLVAAGGAATRTLHSMTEFQPPTRDQILEGLRRTVQVDADLEAWADADFAKTQIPGALESYRMVLRHMNDPENRKRYNTVRRLPYIHLPTLIVWGEQDPINSVELAETLHQGIAGSKLVVLPNHGHFLPTECPGELSGLLLEFLTNGEAQ